MKTATLPEMRGAWSRAVKLRRIASPPATRTLPVCDFLLEDYDKRLVLLTPQTEAAEQWVSDYLPSGERCGGAIVLDPQEAVDVLAGLRRDGLKVSRC